jgi:hypothetical protein
MKDYVQMRRDHFQTTVHIQTTVHSCYGQQKPDTFSGSIPIKSPLKIQRGLIA